MVAAVANVEMFPQIAMDAYFLVVLRGEIIVLIFTKK